MFPGQNFFRQFDAFSHGYSLFQKTLRPEEFVEKAVEIEVSNITLRSIHGVIQKVKSKNSKEELHFI